MPKKKAAPRATIVIQYFDNGVEVEIEHFERLNARKIQRGVEFAERKWQELQQEAIGKVRREERSNAAEAERAAAEQS